MSSSIMVTSRGHTYQLMPREYWHLTRRRAGLLLHNVALAEGICCSMSAFATLPGLEDVVSPYAFGATGDQKEQVWETIREKVSPHHPSRRNAIFLFDDEGLADRLRQGWFGAEDRIKLEARIVEGSRVHRADAKWLDCVQSDWEIAALMYWTGNMTSEPVPEILVHGAVYFPKWREAPFGIGVGFPN